MQLKKILAIFLAATLIFSAFVFPASAETNETLEVGVEVQTTTPISSSPLIVNQGEEVSVKVSVDQNTGISVLSFVLYYDANAFEYVSVTSNNLFGSGETFKAQEGYVLYTFMSINNFFQNTGDLFTVRFKVKEGYCTESPIAFTTSLRDNRPANCIRYGEGANYTLINFVADSAELQVHSIHDAGVVTDPLCLEDGYTTYHCASCDKDVVGNIVPALGHDLINHEAKEENCTEIGWDAYVTCSRCDYTTYVEIPELGHDLIHHEAKEATCLEIGWDAYDTCSRCDYTTYVEIPAKGHTIVNHDAKEVSCLEIGWNAYVTCECCDYTTYEEISALGHDIVYHEAKAATCTDIGWEAYETCSRCDYTTYVEIPALGHDVVNHEGQDATCTEIGWNAYETCTRCDYTTYEEIAALGHDLVSHEGQDATCTEIGWNAYETCSRCDYTTYAEIAALGHSYGEVTVVAPEYGVEGYSVHTCTVCNHEEKFDFVDALTYILGDVDGNELINADDAIHLLYHTLIPDVYTINQTADFDGNGILNADDAIYLLYFTLIPDSYPLNK